MGHIGTDTLVVLVVDGWKDRLIISVREAHRPLLNRHFCLLGMGVAGMCSFQHNRRAKPFSCVSCIGVCLESSSVKS